MRLLAITAGSLILAANCAAQESSTPASAHWPGFVRDHAGQWRVRWNKATQTPKAIFGTGLRLDPGPAETLDDARGRADRVLRTYPDLLGVGESLFVESTGQRILETWIFVYRQQFRGLDVLGGRADVRVHRDGAISMFGSKAVPIPAGFDTVPRIDAAFAGALAWRHVGVENAEREARLIVHADVHAQAPTKPRLAWDVRVSSGSPFVRERVFVDAQDGSIIESWNEVYTCAFGHPHVRGEPSTGSSSASASASGRRDLARSLRALKRGGNLVTGTVLGFMNAGANGGTVATNQPIPDVLVSIDGGNAEFTDADGNFAIAASGTAPVTVRVNLDQLRTRHARGGVHTFEGVGDPFCNPSTPGCVNNPPIVPSAMVSDAVQAVPGGAPVTLQLAASQSEFEVAQVTSYWHVNDVNRWMRGIHGDTTQLNLLSNVAVFDNWGASCNAFYSNNQTHFFSSGSGCVNSGFKTIVYHEWGHGLDDVYGGMAVSQGQQVEGMSEAWGDTVAMYRADSPQIGLGFGFGGLIRSGTNTAQYPPFAFDGPHTQGLSFMGWAWDVRANLRGALGVAAGTARAEQIVLGSIVADAASQPDCVLEVFLLADDDANLLNGTPDYTQLRNASLARSMPFPERVPGEILHSGLDHTQEPHTPRVVRATVVAYEGALTSVDLEFDAGSGPQQRSMIPTSTQDEFIALLPGTNSPRFVEYRIVGRTTLGQTIEWPSDDSGHVYAVGQPVALFVDDLESGVNGWTHAQVANQDDWQRGAPDGDNGDPGSAHSGLFVWANDLGQTIGGQRWNGVYQNDTENWLRTPTIDATAASGVFVEFRRWLNVESGQYDQAEVNVAGGANLWTNPLLDDVTDTAWRLVRLPAPTLDGSLGQIEWRLRTDPGVVFGGWTIDDVGVYRVDPVPDPPVVFTATPAQIPAAGSSLLESLGTPGAPSALLLSAQPGPTPVLPGVTLTVGPSFVAIPISVDGTGRFSNSIQGSSGLAGQLLYAQVLEIAAGSLRGSNAMIFLMTN